MGGLSVAGEDEGIIGKRESGVSAYHRRSRR